MDAVSARFPRGLPRVETRGYPLLSQSGRSASRGGRWRPSPGRMGAGGRGVGGEGSSSAAGLLFLVLSIPVQAQIQFTDVTAAAGVSGDQYRSPTGHSLGVNWIDFDNDGWPDLFAVGGAADRPPHLFHNQGDGTFVRADALLPALPAVEMSGSRFADVDGDGDDDIFIYTDNPDFHTNSDNLPDGPANILLRNRWIENGGKLLEGEPLFEDVTAACGLEDLAPEPFGELPAYRSKTAGFVDYDRDGCIDLYVGHLVMNSGGSEVNKDRLYRNPCDGKGGLPLFEDVTAASGVNDGSDPITFRGALAFGAFHLDGDLWPDLYVVNAAGSDPQPYINDLIYRNDGDGTFTEVTGRMTGIGDDSQAGMGIDVADVDLDGDWDVYLSDLLDTTRDEEPLGNVFYLNNGDGTFADNSAPASGIEGHNSWGVNFFDVDLDGREDLYVSTISSAMTELLYVNNGGDPVTFTNVALAAGLVTGNSRGSAVADYDRDGDLDLAVVDQAGPLWLYRNDSVVSGHWLELKLKGTVSNRDAIGAVVEATAGGVLRMRQIKGGSSAHSQDDLVVHFGLGDATIVDEIRVRWPSGLETTLENVAADQFLTVVEAGIFGDDFEFGDFSGWTP